MFDCYLSFLEICATAKLSCQKKVRKIGNLALEWSILCQVHKIYVKLLLEFFLQNTVIALYINVIVEWGKVIYTKYSKH